MHQVSPRSGFHASGRNASPTRWRGAIAGILWLLAGYPTGASALQVPSSGDSDVPPGCALVGVSGGVVDSHGQITVIVRDLAHNPIPNSVVSIDFSNCLDLVLGNRYYPGVTVDCPHHTASVVTNGLGQAIFRITGYVGNRFISSSGPCAVVRADGVFLRTIRIAAYDQDGANGVQSPGNDATLFQQDLAAYPGSYRARSDYNFDGVINAVDASLLTGVSAGGGSSESVQACDQPVAQEVYQGIDLLETAANQTVDDLSGLNVICPGWEVVGSPVIALRGIPLDDLAACPGADLGHSDTAIRRTQNTSGLVIGGSSTVPIEIVGLHLQSVQPFQVRDLSNNQIRLWTLDVTLPASPPQPSGQMTIVRDNALGGHFSSNLSVRPLLTLTDVTGGAACVHCQVVSPQPIQFTSTNVPWRHPQASDFQVGGCTSNFVAGASPTDPGAPALDNVPPPFSEQAQLAAHGVIPPPPPKVKQLDWQMATHFDFWLMNTGLKPQPIDNFHIRNPRWVPMGAPGALPIPVYIKSTSICDSTPPVCPMPPSPLMTMVDWYRQSPNYRREAWWFFPTVPANGMAPPMDIVFSEPECAMADSGAWYEVDYYCSQGCAVVDSGTFRFHCPPLPPCPPVPPCPPPKGATVSATHVEIVQVPERYGLPIGLRAVPELSAAERNRARLPELVAREAAARPVAPAAGPEVLAGLDFLQTSPGQTYDDLSILNVLCPNWVVVGSPLIPLKGVPLDSLEGCPGQDLGHTDTAIRRTQSTVGLDLGHPATVPIEIVGLHLQSVQPFQVRNVSTNELRTWTLDVTLPRHPAQSLGQMTITKDNAQGGHFSSSFTVKPLVTFTDVTGGAACVECQRYGTQPLSFSSTNVAWRYPLAGDFQVAGCTSNFVPGASSLGPDYAIDNPPPPFSEEAQLAAHGVIPPPPPKLHQHDWQMATHFDFSVMNPGVKPQPIDNFHIGNPRWVPMGAPGALPIPVYIKSTSICDSTPPQCPMPPATMHTMVDWYPPSPTYRREAWWFFPSVPPGGTAPPMDITFSIPDCALPDSGAWYEVDYWCSQGCARVDSGTFRFHCPPMPPCPPDGPCPPRKVDVEPGVGSGGRMLEQNVPNPFSPTTETLIAYALPRAETVELRIYDSQGRVRRTLVSGRQAAGAHQVRWNGTTDAGARLEAGVYYYQLEVAGIRQAKKIVVLK